RALPIGILGSLAICTVLYVAFAFVLTGMVKYSAMRGDAAPVVTAIACTPYHWLQTLVESESLAGFSSVVLVSLLGQSRVFWQWRRIGWCPASSRRSIRAGARR